MSDHVPKLPDPFYIRTDLSDDELDAMMGDEEVLEHFRLAFGEAIPGRGALRMKSQTWLYEKGLIRSKVDDAEEEKKKKRSKQPKMRLVKPDLQPIAQGTPSGKPKAVANLRPYSAIKTETTRWFYPGRMPQGGLTLFTGDPGGGKSIYLCDIATRVSRGSYWPEGGRAPLGSVLIIQQEASKGMEIKPRLEKMGADMERIIDLNNFNRGEKVREAIKLPEDLDVIESCCEQISDLKLVIIDPIADLFNGRNSSIDSDVRDALLPLLNLAAKCEFAVAAVIQFNKDSDRPLKYRMANSAAFVQIARMAWFVSDDPRSANKKVISLAKHNPDDAVKTGLSWALSEGRLLFDRKPVPFSGEQIDAALQKQRLQAANEVLAVSTEKEWKRIARMVEHQLTKNGEMSRTAILELAEEAGFKETPVKSTLKRLSNDEGRDPVIERVSKEVNGVERIFYRMFAKPAPSIDLAKPSEPAPILEPSMALATVDPFAKRDFTCWLRGKLPRPWSFTLWRRATRAF